MTKKKDLEQKKELAKLLYMGGETQKIIAEKAGVSAVTVNKWVSDGGWAERRAAENVTRPELVNKILRAINDVIDKVNTSDDQAGLDSIGDKLSKLASVIEKLDKKANIVDHIETFMAFGKWMQYRMSFDPEVTPELIKAINKYQDLFISENLGKRH